MFTLNALMMLLQHKGSPNVYRLRIRLRGITVPGAVEFIGFTGHDKGIIVKDNDGEFAWMNTSEIVAVEVLPCSDA